MLAFAAAATLLSLTSAAQATNVLTAPPARRTAHADIARDIAARQATDGSVAPVSASPLTDYHIPYTAIPYQVNPYQVARGPQSGYNLCNSTTEGDASQCQTLIANSLDDFCLWGSPKAGDVIGNVEAAVVAYCAKSGHGSRLMPPGTLTGVQFMKTSAYIQITGHINQPGIGLAASDLGGELDPHGADLAGNPLGGLVYSTGLPSGDNTSYVQAVEWNNFVGGGMFCIKLCDPTITSPNYCENRYDLIGCAYNMPAAYKDNEFTSCEGELQDIVGVYTGTDGQTSTWHQTDPLTEAPPYQPRVPASSNCQTFSSAALYGGSATASASGSAASVTGSSHASGASGSKTSATGSRTGSGSAAGASSTSTTSGAGRVAASGALALVFGAIVMLL